MTMPRSNICWPLASLALLAACNQSQSPASNDTLAAATPAAAANDPIASAMSAAPASIAADAAVVAPGHDGAMQTLRDGKNGWTCMPDMPETPGPDPMCLDANAVQWAMAWKAGKTPPPGIGLAYMLAGGVDASNTDPKATAPAPGQDWVRTGPHIMVLGAPELNKGYKAGDNPDTKAPYVMFGGTPYAHLMVPVG